MFFMMGITDGRKDFDFHQQIICDICGKYGRFQVFMTYTVLSLFFIPCFKWNKHYYVQTSCCNTVYELDAEIGKRIAAGDDMKSALTYANVAASLSTEKFGAQTGMPTAEEVANELK